MINPRRALGQAMAMAAAGILLAAGGASAGGPGMQDHMHHHAAHPAPAVLVDMVTDPAEVKAASQATIRFLIRNDDGTPQRDLTITHDRLVHVMIISRDFSLFSHIHPEDFGPVTREMKDSGSYFVRYAFPKAGEYLIALDSAVAGSPFSEQFSLEVGGEPRMGTFTRDFSRSRNFSGYEVRLETSPGRIRSGQETTLKYFISKNGSPVTDLEPYLSAGMHLAVVSADLSNFIHAHGGPPGMKGGHSMDHMHMAVPNKFGPLIEAAVVFPAKGLYQIFGEIKHGGRVITTSFMVEAE